MTPTAATETTYGPGRRRHKPQAERQTRAEKLADCPADSLEALRVRIADALCELSIEPADLAPDQDTPHPLARALWGQFGEDCEYDPVLLLVKGHLHVQHLYGGLGVHGPGGATAPGGNTAGPDSAFMFNVIGRGESLWATLLDAETAIDVAERAGIPLASSVETLEHWAQALSHAPKPKQPKLPSPLAGFIPGMVVHSNGAAELTFQVGAKETSAALATLNGWRAEHDARVKAIGDAPQFAEVQALLDRQRATEETVEAAKIQARQILADVTVTDDLDEAERVQSQVDKCNRRSAAGELLLKKTTTALLPLLAAREEAARYGLDTVTSMVTAEKRTVDEIKAKMDAAVLDGYKALVAAHHRMTVIQRTANLTAEQIAAMQ